MTLFPGIWPCPEKVLRLCVCGRAVQRWGNHFCGHIDYSPYKKAMSRILSSGMFGALTKNLFCHQDWEGGRRHHNFIDLLILIRWLLESLELIGQSQGSHRVIEQIFFTVTKVTKCRRIWKIINVNILDKDWDLYWSAQFDETRHLMRTARGGYRVIIEMARGM